MNYTLSRSVARALATEYPVGEPFSGPAYAHSRIAAAMPGHRDFVGDIIGGVADAVGGVVEGAVDAVGDIAKSPAGPLLGAVLGGIFLPGAFGISGMLGSALGAGTMSFLATGDPLKALVSGGMSYLGASLFEGASGVISEGGAGAFGGEALGDTVAGAASDSIASQVAGTSTNPESFLMASAAPSSGTMTDVTAGMLNGAADAAVGGAGAVDAFSGSMPAAIKDPVAFAPGGPASGGGIIDRFLKWGEEYPVLASGALQLGGGIIGGIGQNITANQVMDKKIAAEREMQAQKTADAMALEEWKRRFIQGGAYGAGKVPFTPTGDTVLRRPDGSPVYQQPGIVLGAMNG